ncbi:hypothetical protein QJQ45_021438 [Haematococcus lacustris]|nr:hypothetical protein QJQ45_021438 [Haematococcus lacustris]
MARLAGIAGPCCSSFVKAPHSLSLTYDVYDTHGKGQVVPRPADAQRKRKASGEAHAARDRDHTYHGLKCKLAQLTGHLPQALWAAFLLAVLLRVKSCSERAVVGRLLLGLLVRDLFSLHVADQLDEQGQPVYTAIPVSQAAIPNLSCRNPYLQLCRGLLEKARTLGQAQQSLPCWPRTLTSAPASKQSHATTLTLTWWTTSASSCRPHLATCLRSSSLAGSRMPAMDQFVLRGISAADAADNLHRELLMHDEKRFQMSLDRQAAMIEKRLPGTTNFGPSPRLNLAASPSTPPALARTGKAHEIGGIMPGWGERLASSSPRSAKCKNSTPRWIQAWHTSTRGFHASWAASATSLEEVASDVHAAADQLTSLESRLAELEGIEGMRTTVHSLAQLLDACQGQPDAITEQVMAELFTPTAVVAAEHHGVADGLDEVTELFKQVVQGLSFSRHYVSNLVAKVSKDDPSSGKAKFYLLVAASLAKGRDAWGMEVVEVKLRKGFDARWRIRNIQWQTGNILTPYDGKGWGSTPNILPPVNAGPNFVMICSDTAAAHSIISIKHDEDKIIPIDSHKVFGIAGESGDRVNFSEFIVANVKLYALRNSTELSTKAVAHFTRSELSKALRKSPYHCNLLLGGYDERTGPSLFWMDYLGTLTRVNTGGTGYGAMFVLSLFDKLWHPDLTEAEAVDMMEQGIAELKRRLVVVPPAFNIKIVDKDGIRLVKTL